MMKRLLLILTIVTAMGLHHVQAYHLQSRLILNLHNNQPFQVFINGQQMGHFSNRHKISNLAPGVHQMKVVALVTNPHTLTNGRTIVYNGPVSIRGGFVSNITVQCHNSSLLYGDMIALAPPPCGGTCGGAGQCGPGSVHGQVQGRGRLIVGRTLQQPLHRQPAVCGVGTITPGYGQLPPQVIDPVVYGPVAIDDVLFNELIITLQNRNFESTRKNIALQWIAQYHFTSYQIKELMMLMTFESSRMEIAQAGFLKVVDPDFFHVTFDALTFDSSVNRLLDYMATV